MNSALKLPFVLALDQRFADVLTCQKQWQTGKPKAGKVQAFGEPL